MFGSALLDDPKAVFIIVHDIINNIPDSSISNDVWSNTYGAPILGMTWHFWDAISRVHIIPIASLNIGTAPKTGLQLCKLMEQTWENKVIVESDQIQVRCTMWQPTMQQLRHLVQTFLPILFDMFAVLYTQLCCV